MRLLFVLYTILHFEKKRKKNRKGGPAAWLLCPPPVRHRDDFSAFGRWARSSSSSRSTAAPSRSPAAKTSEGLPESAVSEVRRGPSRWRTVSLPSGRGSATPSGSGSGAARRGWRGQPALRRRCAKPKRQNAGKPGKIEPQQLTQRVHRRQIDAAIRSSVDPEIPGRIIALTAIAPETNRYRSGQTRSSEKSTRSETAASSRSSVSPTTSAAPSSAAARTARYFAAHRAPRGLPAETPPRSAPETDCT